MLKSATISFSIGGCARACPTHAPGPGAWVGHMPRVQAHVSDVHGASCCRGVPADAPEFPGCQKGFMKPLGPVGDADSSVKPYPSEVVPTWVSNLKVVHLSFSPGPG